ncbi:MAG: hypothetical protein CL739_08105 [Chloroflexi bacterium]|nr:hypothetical protein [Chloroflexota bacterium]
MQNGFTLIEMMMKPT